MSFRGCDEDVARREALAISERWIEIDAEAEADPWYGEPVEPDGDYPGW